MNYLTLDDSFAGIDTTLGHDVSTPVSKSTRTGADLDALKVGGTKESVTVRWQRIEDGDEWRNTVFEISDKKDLDDRTLSRRREWIFRAGRPLISHPAPESAAIKQEQEQHREVLAHYYYDGHSAEQIQIDLSLTATQLRLIKSRAKERFATLCRARFGKRTRPTEAPAEEDTDRPAAS